MGGWNGNALAPAAFWEQPDNPRANWRPRTVERGLDHLTSDVPAGPPAVRRLHRPVDLAPVERDRADGHERLARRGRGLGYVTQLDLCERVGRSDECQHRGVGAAYRWCADRWLASRSSPQSFVKSRQTEWMWFALFWVLSYSSMKVGPFTL